MGNILKPQSGKPTSSTTFENTIERFIKLRADFPELECISLRLPYGLLKQRNSRHAFYIDTGKGEAIPLKYEVYTPDGFHEKRAQEDGKSNYLPMVIKHSRGKINNKTLVLSQRFDTFISNPKKPLFTTDQYVNKKSGYLYRWNEKGAQVTISKLIGTTNVNKIKSQVSYLSQECLRFIFVYCQG